MCMRELVYIFAVMLIWVSCGSVKEQKRTEQSEDLRNEINALLPDLEQKLTTLRSHANSINIQGRGLTTMEIEQTAAISGLLQTYADWKSQYDQVQFILETNQAEADNLYRGYQRSLKELQTLHQRAKELTSEL